MEAFALLSRGGPRFNKSKYKDQLKLFDNSAASKPTASSSKALPAELDFFHNAKESKPAPKSDKAKGKRPAAPVVESEGEDAMDDDEDGSDSESEDDEGAKSSRGPSGDSTNKKSKKKGRSTMHRTAATGSRVPKVAADFDSLQTRYSIPQLLLDNMASSGFAHPTAIQSQAMPILLEKRDLAGISPTGTGKTLAYLLPLFTLLDSPKPADDKDSEKTGPRALIVCPTRELSGQIYNECLKLAQGRKWNILLASKAASSNEEKKSRGKLDIVIGTPLRLVAALREGTLPLNNVRYLVLDEADNLLDPGFIKQTEEVLESCTHPDLQRSIFSATLPPVAEQVAKRVLVDPIRVVVGMRDAASLHVSQTLTYCGSESGKLYALRQLLVTNPPLPMLIFVQSKERATELYQELLYDNITVDQLHSDMTSKQRLESVARMRNGETWVMVCTEVMARGMDFGGIKGVVNYDFPTTLQAYVHRIGRTGRAGRSGIAITYFTDDDVPYLRPIARMIHQVNLQQTAFANASESNMDPTLRESIVAPSTPIPEWMLSLQKVNSTRLRRLQRRTGVERKGVTEVAGGLLGKKEAIKKREMINASKRRMKFGHQKIVNPRPWGGVVPTSSEFVA